METNFDCIVIGAGPAGLSAALNLRQRGKTVLVVHSGETLLAKAEQVDNYLGMPGLSGKQMMERFTQHARDAGAVLRKGRAGNVMPFGGRFMVNLDGDILETGAVVPVSYTHLSSVMNGCLASRSLNASSQLCHGFSFRCCAASNAAV